jgi:very-short-patch-repair endonuclease
MGLGIGWISLPRISEGEELINAFLGELSAEFGFEFVREFRFHAVRRWRFDFAIPGLLLAVEFEGGAWTGGRHTRGSGFVKDCEKYNAAAVLGWGVLRFTTDMLGGAKDVIRSAVESKKLDAGGGA